MEGKDLKAAEEEGLQWGFFLTGTWLPIFIMGIDLFINKGVPSLEYYATAGLVIVILLVSVAVSVAWAGWRQSRGYV